jgi:hypothetical protein
MTETKNPLLDKIVTAIHLASDKKAIRFDVANEEPLIAKTDGDCCSHSWIEHVENADAIIGTPILSVEDLPLESEDSDDGRIMHYGLKITTAKGTCVLDYRNESNGYYGGNLSWPNDCYLYGGVYGQNISNEDWQQIT